MRTLIAGFLLTCAVVVYAMEGQFDLYFQPHSLILVCGGTMTILLFMTPMNILRNLWEALRGLFTAEESIETVKNELAALSRSKTNPSSLKNPLIKYASDLWVQGIDPDLFVVMLSQKKNELIEDRLDAIQTLKNFAKYPPALGMTGTVMGMVSLFSQLDTKQGSIGASLAMAMTATFYGLILTNALLSPLADRMHVKNIHYQRFCTNLYEILLLINQNEPESFIEDEVSQRVS